MVQVPRAISACRLRHHSLSVSVKYIVAVPLLASWSLSLVASKERSSCHKQLSSSLPSLEPLSVLVSGVPSQRYPCLTAMSPLALICFHISKVVPFISSTFSCRVAAFFQSAVLECLLFLCFFIHPSIEWSKNLSLKLLEFLLKALSFLIETGLHRRNDVYSLSPLLLGTPSRTWSGLATSYALAMRTSYNTTPHLTWLCYHL